MNSVLNQYKKVAFLSYQLIVHFKSLQVINSDIVLAMEVKHIYDTKYEPIVLTIPRKLDFTTASHPAFLHIFENFHKYSSYVKPSMGNKIKKKKVTFDKIVQVRINGEECQEYCEYLID